MSFTEAAITPKHMVRSGLCIGCGACASVDPGLDMQLDRYGQFHPAGMASAPIARLCPFSPVASNEDQIGAALFPAATHVDNRICRYEAAYFGYAADSGFRDEGSSGGLTNWMACELLRLDMVDGVVHVGPGRTDRGEPLFGYRISRTAEQVRARAKSRYFPVELSQVLEEIRATPGRYAVVGIPCFIKAVHLLRASDPTFAERIVYTLGLFCGHMKSAGFAASLAGQLGYELGEVSHFEFRRKDASRPANWYRAEAEGPGGETRAEDWWHMVDGDWGAGFFQNAACDYCDDVVAELADISFGDAWIDPYQADGRGTNVMIVRNKVLQQLVVQARAEARIVLDDTDADGVVATQAAGFRQRREGLAYRLASRGHRGIIPIKRVVPRTTGISLRRKAIYNMRQGISRWSHRVFWLGKRINALGLYRGWANVSLRLYQALAYSRGPVGNLLDRLLGPDTKKAEIATTRRPTAS